MKRQQTIFAAVGLLLMALLFTSCSQTPSSSGETTVATSAVMAMSEAVSAAEKNAAGVTEIATNKYEVKSFTADDGTQFITDMLVPDYEIGKTYIVTHDGTMTRSLPGKYLNVTRIMDLEQTLNA